MAQAKSKVVNAVNKAIDKAERVMSENVKTPIGTGIGPEPPECTPETEATHWRLRYIDSQMELRREKDKYLRRHLVQFESGHIKELYGERMAGGRWERFRRDTGGIVRLNRELIEWIETYN